MRNPEPLSIAVRAWTERVDAKASTPPGRAHTKRPSPKWPRSVLVFDTETTIDAALSLNFGAYRYLRWAEGALECLEEGLFYADDLAERGSAGLKELRDYASSRAADVAGDSRELRYYSRRQFLAKVFWPAYEARALFVGFNLPFDLTRLASDFGKARGWYWRGFSLVLAEYQDKKTGAWTENRYCPRVCYKPVDSKRAFIGFQGGRDNVTPRYAGHFLDLKTLAFALTSRGLSLEKAATAFGVAHGKQHAAEHGRITAEYIDYNRADVRATCELLEKLRAEFDRHPIDLDPCKAYSPATLAKAYLRATGLKIPREKFRSVPPHVYAAAMHAYFGGRAECRIRKTAVPVVYTDFLSMYPTVNALMGLWQLLTAARLEIVDCTAEIRDFLAGISLERCFDPAAWRELRFFGLAQPRGDILPVRARYSEATDALNIGVNALSSVTPLWYSGPDLIAAALLTGRAPEIMRAFRIVPRGTQAGLTAVRLRGELSVNPRTEDFFRSVIERRKLVKKATHLDPEEGERLDKFLKVIANSGSYGIFAEFNPKELRVGESVTVRVHGLERNFDCNTDSFEEPGKFTFPPVAALITGAARLMLALLERCVADAGGTYAFCDTDSMGIVATELGGLTACEGGPERLPDGRDAIRALSWEQVQTIVERFAALNPYDRTVVPGSILKVEDENFVDQQQRQLFAYVISAKRYALFTRDANGRPEIVKYSEHGLGHLLNPTDPGSDNREWMRQLWELIVSKRLGLTVAEPDWLDRPAISRVTITTPEQLEALEHLKRAAHGPRLKPANFIVSAHVAHLGHPTDVDPTHFHLIAPFTSDARQWLKMTWIDQYSGESYHISTRRSDDQTARVQSYRDVLADYCFHPEPKSAALDGTPCDRRTVGLLQRRHVRPLDLVYIGKETNELEAVDAGLVHDSDEVIAIYVDERNGSWTRDVLAALKRIPCKRLAEAAGVSERTIQRIRNGHQTPSAKIRRRLTALCGRAPTEL